MGDSMDLLELNDIYCKDKARIKADKFFRDPVRVEYSFTPTEEECLSTGCEMISAVINRPFVGISSISLRHSLLDFYTEIHKHTPVTDYVFGCNPDIVKGDADMSWNERNDQYVNLFCNEDLHCHLDIAFSDKIPGLTLIMDQVKNTNNLLSNDEWYDMGVSSSYNIEGIGEDGRSLSLIYIPKEGKKLYGYGSVIYTGRGLRSIDEAMKIFLLSNTYIVSRAPDMQLLPEYKVMKTSCVIIYEDSLERVLKLIEKEN